jgi:fatty-acyl-CoA synthase
MLLSDIPAQRAVLAPDRLAMQDLATGEQLSYGQLDDRTGRAAGALAALGVAAGDRLAVLCRNRIEFFELLFACARLGAILVPLNWRMPPAELRLLMEDCGAGWLVYGAEDAEAAAQLGPGPERRIGLDDSGPDGYRARREPATAIAGRPGQSLDDIWYLLYTSGTTGRPKAVIQTPGMALANYVNISQATGLRAGDTTLCFLPLFHTGGINLLALPALIMGAKVLITPDFDLERTIKLLAEGSLDVFFAVPAVYQAISLHPGFDELDLSLARCCVCGGAPMPDALFSRFEQRGAVVLNGMGMTETGPTVFVMDAENARRKIGSVGKPQVLAAVRIVDESGQDVDRGETGELWFAGPGVTPGYLGRPEETAAALVDGAWLRSGDLARQDEQGYYYIAGRLKDMYISGGENVYPAEVENRLALHPDVLEAAVVGVPDPRWGEVGCAYLVPRPGHDLPGDAEMTAWLREFLAPYKVPRHFVPVADFPRNAAGKVLKHQLPDAP